MDKLAETRRKRDRGGSGDRPPIPDILPVLPAEGHRASFRTSSCRFRCRARSRSTRSTRRSPSSGSSCWSRRGRPDRDAEPRRPLPRRHRGRDHADAEAAGRAHPPARPGASRARASTRSLSEEPYLKAKITQLEETTPAKELPPEHEALVRSVKQNLEKSVSLGKTISPEVMVIAANLDGPRPPGGPRGVEPRAEAGGRAAHPREHRRRSSGCGSSTRTSPGRSRSCRCSRRSRLAGARRDGPVAARVLPAPAAARDPAGARRGRGAVGGARRATARRSPTKKIPPEAAAEIEKQIKRLERSHPDSAETAIIRTYLDWMTGLPWGDVLGRRRRPRSRPRRSSTRTTTTSRRSRSASSNSSRCTR